MKRRNLLVALIVSLIIAVIMTGCGNKISGEPISGSENNQTADDDKEKKQEDENQGNNNIQENLPEDNTSTPTEDGQLENNTPTSTEDGQSDNNTSTLTEDGQPEEPSEGNLWYGNYNYHITNPSCPLLERISSEGTAIISGELEESELRKGALFQIEFIPNSGSNSVTYTLWEVDYHEKEVNGKTVPDYAIADDIDSLNFAFKSYANGEIYLWYDNEYHLRDSYQDGSLSAIE